MWGICLTLRDNNARLKAKVTNLESRSRKQNMRILGSPESTESGTPTEFFLKLLYEIFGNNSLPSPPEIDRAHHSLASKLAPGQRPRPVILSPHQYQTKDLVIRETWQRGKLQYNGQPVRVVEDYRPKVPSQRAEYSRVMAELYKLGLKPVLLYLARLRLTLSGGPRKWISSMDEAHKYIDSLHRPRKRP